MAKKFVRGVTGVDDIESFDKSLTNVNDLISDGQNTYVHTKKGKVESYYNLTENLKAITSDNSDLITVTKDDTTNTVTIHPKHDAQKEQSIESTRSTITIQKGGNGTSETTKVDTNPQKVLEHENLLTDYGISKVKSGSTITLGLEYTLVSDGFDLNNLKKGKVRCSNFVNAPASNTFYFVSAYSGGNNVIQEATTLFNNNVKYVRKYINSVWGAWSEQVTDKSTVEVLLAQKQDPIQSNISIAILPNNQLRQLFAFKHNYNHTNGLLKTHIKSLAANTNQNTPVEEFNFTLKINQGSQDATFTLDEGDKNKFNSIITTYGVGSSVRINGCLFSLSESTLTVSTEANTGSNYVITFSDII